jgi:hypothetical protein
MAIFRGIGGAGDSTTDATVTAVTEQATNAASSASAASSSASAAATSASSAGTSASNAASSEAGVAASAASAAASAASATASKVAAAASETAAGASETAAAASESAAATSASNAASSASSASTSASTATTQASLATTNGAAQVALAATQASLATTNGAAQVALATTQATNSASSASTATTKASEAATSATNAGTSASNAASSASAAASSASSASASADAALTALDNFDDRYLGQKASDPTVDNDGNALIAGALYFNTTDSVMKVYEGSIWVAAYASLSGALIAANNLSDVANVASSRTNLGLGSGDSPTFAGLTATNNLNVVANTSSDVMRITQTGSGNAFVVEDSTSPDGSPFAINASGVVLVGNTTAQTISGITPAYQQLGSGNYSALWLGKYAANASANYIYLSKSRSGTVGSNAVVSNNDDLGTLAFYGDDGTSLIAAATILGEVDGTPGTNDMPGRLVFSTTADGASSPTERLRITSAGNVGIGTTSVSAPIHVYKQEGDVTARFQRLSGQYIDVVQDGGINEIYAVGKNLSFTQADALDMIFRTTDAERLRITSAGKVGIGTSSPSGALHVNNGDVYFTQNTNADVFITATPTTSSRIWFGDTDSSTTASIQYQHSNDSLKFATNGNTERMRIDSAGNVGIGVSSPVNKLEVNGIVQANTGVILDNIHFHYLYGNDASQVNVRFNDGATALGYMWLKNFSSGVNGIGVSSGNLAFGTADLERMRITSAGNVGIGTNSPRAAGGYTSLCLNNSTTGAFIDFSTAGTRQATITATAALFDFQSALTAPMTFSTNGAVERMRIDSSGNVGIGIIPTGRFHVLGGAGSELIIGYAGASTNYIDANTQIFRNGGKTETMRIDASGNVGIGTSAPNYKMSVNGTGNFYSGVSGLGRMFLGDPTDTSGYVGLYRSALGPANSTTAANGLNFASIDGYTFNTGAVAFGAQTERMRIDSSGNVGIGTTSPTAVFTNYKSLYLNGSSGSAIQMQYGGNLASNIVADNNALYLQNISAISFNVGGTGTGTERARIDSSGNLLVGKTTTGRTVNGTEISNSGSVKATSTVDAGEFYRKTSNGGAGVILTFSDVGGTANLVGAAFANGTFSAVSDARMKKNVEDSRSYLQDVMSLRVVKYNWTTDEENTPKELGWIAQEVEQVFPGMVSEMGDSKLLKKEVFLPMLMKCIQEQQTIIESLTARVSALEGN